MWYWLLMGGLLLSMLLLMRLNKPKLFAASKLFILIALAYSLAPTLNSPQIAPIWSMCALAFFALCYYVETFATRYKILQFLWFSMGCLFYSLSFWSQVQHLNWAVPIALFALIVVIFFILLPLLDSFVKHAAVVAIILWQLLWASGQVWQVSRSLLDLSGFLGTALLATSVLIWSIHHFKRPFKMSNDWTMLCYFGSHILIIAPLVLASA
ncbi:lysoplasmalogenase family protein [Vibrio gangliei]|uniref:lysoplasmalogenase family protein n=1 Tax=Vibrio gangliei TaxID=2077090 RepID=UPI000D01E86E|nr:lysoplasmalogenase family protein [Vibrio gangliei]